MVAKLCLLRCSDSTTLLEQFRKQPQSKGGTKCQRSYLAMFHCLVCRWRRLFKAVTFTISIGYGISFCHTFAHAHRKAKKSNINTSAISFSATTTTLAHKNENNNLTDTHTLSLVLYQENNMLLQHIVHRLIFRVIEE